MNDNPEAGQALLELEEKHQQFRTDEEWLKLMLSEFRPQHQISMHGYLDAALKQQVAIGDLQTSFQKANELVEVGDILMTPEVLKTLIQVETTLRVRHLYP